LLALHRYLLYLDFLVYEVTDDSIHLLATREKETYPQPQPHPT
jgi:hypothetical protein